METRLAVIVYFFLAITLVHLKYHHYQNYYGGIKLVWDTYILWRTAYQNERGNKKIVL